MRPELPGSLLRKRQDSLLSLRTVDSTRKAPSLRIVKVNVRDEPVAEQPFDLGTHGDSFADGCVDDHVRGIVCAYRHEAAGDVTRQFADAQRAPLDAPPDEDRARRVIWRRGGLMDKRKEQQLFAFPGVVEADAAREAWVPGGDVALCAHVRKLFVRQLKEWFKLNVVDADELKGMHDGLAVSLVDPWCRGFT